MTDYIPLALLIMSWSCCELDYKKMVNCTCRVELYLFRNIWWNECNQKNVLRDFLIFLISGEIWDSPSDSFTSLSFFGWLAVVINHKKFYPIIYRMCVCLSCLSSLFHINILLKYCIIVSSLLHISWYVVLYDEVHKVWKYMYCKVSLSFSVLYFLSR